MIPNPWNLFNLSASPFFQQPLESSEHTPRPLSLFVGRETELRRLRQTIHGAGRNSSTQAVAGSAGVGKTTLIKELKARLSADGYFTSDDVVPILPGDTVEALFGRILSGLYDTLLANRPACANSAAMLDAQQLIRVVRRTSGGISLGFGGIGSIGANRGQSLSVPKDVLIDGPRVLRDLLAIVQSSDGQGILLHLNNLENLSDSDARNAADLLRALRDFVFMRDGLHSLIVGTTDAVNTAVHTHAQMRFIGTIPVEPLDVSDVQRLLAARYAHLRIDDQRPQTPPVDEQAVATMHELFGGDLRGMLKALEDGVTPEIGLRPDEPSARRFTDVALVLQARYADELTRRLDDGRVEQLTRWAASDPLAAHSQRSLGALWGLKQAAVSAAVNQLIREGYLVLTTRRGPTPTQYRLSGFSRLIFGATPT